jgi:hypothetical protein
MYNQAESSMDIYTDNGIYGCKFAVEVSKRINGLESITANNTPMGSFDAGVPIHQETIEGGMDDDDMVMDIANEADAPIDNAIASWTDHPMSSGDNEISQGEIEAAFGDGWMMMIMDDDDVSNIDTADPVSVVDTEDAGDEPVEKMVESVVYNSKVVATDYIENTSNLGEVSYNLMLSIVMAICCPVVGWSLMMRFFDNNFDEVKATMDRIQERGIVSVVPDGFGGNSITISRSGMYSLFNISNSKPEEGSCFLTSIYTNASSGKTQPGDVTTAQRRNYFSKLENSWTSSHMKGGVSGYHATFSYLKVSTREAFFVFKC